MSNIPAKLYRLLQFEASAQKKTIKKIMIAAAGERD